MLHDMFYEFLVKSPPSPVSASRADLPGVGNCSDPVGHILCSPTRVIYRSTSRHFRTPAELLPGRLASGAGGKGRVKLSHNLPVRVPRRGRNPIHKERV